MAPDYKIQEVKTPRATVLLACFLCQKNHCPAGLWKLRFGAFCPGLAPACLKVPWRVRAFSRKHHHSRHGSPAGWILLGTFILKKRHPVHPTDILDTRFEWKAFGGVFVGSCDCSYQCIGNRSSTQLFTPLLGADRLQSILLQETSRVNIFLLSSWRLVVATIMVCVVGPISEELFFRDFSCLGCTHLFANCRVSFDFPVLCAAPLVPNQLHSYFPSQPCSLLHCSEREPVGSCWCACFL